jgi:hypothetical protein
MIISASGMYLPDRRRVRSSMVADQRLACLSSGVYLRIHSMSSMNPMSSILSASSMTSDLIFPSSKVPLLMWSMSLPGVPTTMWTPLLSSLICLSMETPP